VSARVEQLPTIVGTGQAAGRLHGDGPVLASGCIDAYAEQLVAGATEVADVHVLLGTTVIVWVVLDPPAEVPGVFTIPHSASGRLLAGGPSDAGGLFVSWATGLLPDGARDTMPTDPGRVPVWLPYPRGERVGMRSVDRRAELADLDITHDARAVARAAYEATGFVVRHIVDLVRDATGVNPRRVVMTGGGTLVDPWVQAVADVTALPVSCAAVPEGGALGAALIARVAAGLEAPTAMGDNGWARTGRVVEPDARWVTPADDRYRRFCALSAREA
jgi:xylulokinase